MAADDLARMRAEMDQAREQMRELGRNLRGFYDGCTESGFTDEQALQLTGTFLTQALSSAAMQGISEDALRRMLGEDGD